jgi:uncharacterized protein with von Willebrand factor type A (vWA) domain
MQEIFKLATHTYGGGTNFDAAFKIMLDVFENLDEEGKQKADLLMITDGESELKPETIERFLDMKEQYGCRLFVLLVSDQKQYTEIQELADRVLDFTTVDEIAETLASLMWE